MGYSQAVRHQTLTLAFSLVRIQLSQPKKGLAIGGSFFWLGWRQCDQALAMQVRWFAFPPQADGSSLTRGAARNHGAKRSYPAIFSTLPNLWTDSDYRNAGKLTVDKVYQLSLYISANMCYNVISSGATTIREEY